MIISLISFSEKGARLGADLAAGFEAAGHKAKVWAPVRFAGAEGKVLPLNESLSNWTEREFFQADGLIFVCAAGIAVRAVAPFVKKKTTDPAVVVVDDLGQFSISLLSGHLGGANELAKKAAEICHAVPVITTATDGRGLFAVDEFARKNNLWIADMSLAKSVSAALLEGKKAVFHCDFPVEGRLPEELLWDDGKGKKDVCCPEIHVTVKAEEKGKAFSFLRLVPKAVVLGIGCRKGTEKEKIAWAVLTFLAEEKLDERAVAAAASIDLKKGEAGLVLWARESKIPLSFYSSQELSMAEGKFEPSPFVKGITGVDNVCQRAAVWQAGLMGGGRLITGKWAMDGVTVSAAVVDKKIQIE